MYFVHDHFVLLDCSVCHCFLPILFSQVKEDNHYIADFGYGGSDFRHLWAEPEKDQASALYLDASFEKAFKIDDVSSVFHYELIAENGNEKQYFFLFLLSSSYFVKLSKSLSYIKEDGVPLGIYLEWSLSLDFTDEVPVPWSLLDAVSF